MARAKITRLNPAKPKPVVDGDEQVSGSTLRVSASTLEEYSSGVDDMVGRMVREVEVGLREIFNGAPSEAMDSADNDSFAVRLLAQEFGVLPSMRQIEAVAMDAGITSDANKFLRLMLRKFTALFETKGRTLTERMVERTFDNSETGVKKSLKEVSEKVTLDSGAFTEQFSGVAKAHADEAVDLIKTVPKRYLGDIKESVYESVTTGQGLADLIPKLEEQNHKVKNWAKNVAMDQTRKTFNGINVARMKKSGAKKFQWIHTAGSLHPRAHHKAQYPAGLNGGIFSFDDLPIIDERTGERGIPGQAPYCRCTMRPVFEFDED